MKNLKKLMYLFIAGALVVACGKDEKKAEGTEQNIEAGADTVTYKIDPAASQVKWLGKKVTGQHNGTIAVQGGEVSAAGTSVTGGTINIDMASISNEDLTDAEMNGKLVGHLKTGDFFAVDSFPTAAFVITNVKDGADGKKEVTGNLTIKGITNEVSFPAEVKTEGDKLIATGKAVIDRTKWNIQYGSGKFFQDLGDKMIYDDIELDFNVTASK